MHQLDELTAGGKVLFVPNPLAPDLGSQLIDVAPGETVTQAIARSDLKLRYSTVLCRRGELVRRSDWDLVPLDEGELVSLVTLPQGGGGGASQIIGMLALIALSVLTYGATASLLGATFLGSEIAAQAVTALVTGLVVIGGQALLSALIPHPKKPQITGPDYAIFNQSNSARLGFPVPEQFGKFIQFPALASVPYTDWADNHEHIYQLFCLGVGEYEIEQIRIAQTVIYENGAVTGSYPDLQVEIVPPGGTMTLFPGNVITSTEVQSITMLGTNEAGYGWLGPFIANPAGTQATQIAVDVALPAGLFHTTTSGHIHNALVTFAFQAQEIDNSGSPIGSWFNLGTRTTSFKMATRDAQYQTLIGNVPAGRYQVRAERTNAKATDGSTADLIVWVGMRAFLPGPQTYANVTTIAVRAAPTQGLNSTTASQFNVIATRKLPIYDTGTDTWSANTATRSIAAAAAYMCKTDNGANLPDSRIDLALLFGSLATTWDDRGDTFDGIFYTRASFWECLQTVLKAGRSVPLLAGQTVSFVRDEPKAVYRTAFSPRNMLANSFQVDYLMYTANSADAVWIEYMDERIWQSQTVFCALPDFAGDMNDPRVPTLKWDGIVNRTQAWREGINLVASNRYRRAFPSFRTELDGRVCFRGDLVKISHWLPEWGASMEVLSAVTDAGGDILTLSEPWNPPDTGTKLARLTTPDGKVYGPVHFTLLDDGSGTRQAEIQLTTTMDPGGTYTGQLPHQWPTWSGDGLQEERPQAVLGTADTMDIDALVVSMKPERGATCTLVAVVDDTRVYSADGTVPTFPDVTGLSAEDLTITYLTVERITVADGNAISYSASVGATVIFVAINGAPDAISFEAQWKWGDATDYAVPLVEKRTFEIAAEDADLSLQVRAKGRFGWGNWFSGTLASTDDSGSGNSGSGSVGGGGVGGGAGADFLSIIDSAGLATHVQFAIDAGSADSYAGSGQTITDLTGNGINWYLGATSGGEGSDPTFHGSAGGLSVNEYFLFGTALAGGASGKWLTLAEANPAWVTALHQGAGNFTVAALIYFAGHPAGADFAWISPFSSTDGTLQHEGASVEFYSEAQVVSGTTYYTAFVQANVNRSAGADAEQAGYTWYPTSTTPTPAGFYFIEISVNQISGVTLCFINGVQAAESGIGPSGGTDGNAADITLSTGGANASMASGSRFVMSAAWDVALDSGQLANLYAQVQQYRADFALP